MRPYPESWNQKLTKNLYWNIQTIFIIILFYHWGKGGEKKFQQAKQVVMTARSRCGGREGGGCHDKLRCWLAWHLWQTRGRMARRWWRRSRRRGTGDNPSRLTHLISSICVAETRRFHPRHGLEIVNVHLEGKPVWTPVWTFLPVPIFFNRIRVFSLLRRALKSWWMSRRRPQPSAD